MFNHQVVSVGFARKIKPVREPGTAASVDGDTKVGGIILPGENRVNPAGSRRSQADIRGN